MGFFSFLNQWAKSSETASRNVSGGDATPKENAPGGYDEIPEEDASDSGYDDEIDNSELSDELSEQVNRFSLRLNPDSRGQEQLETSRKILCEKFPLLRGLDPDDCLPELLNKAFPDGMPRRLFIRTLSFGHDGVFPIQRIFQKQKTQNP